MRLPVEPLEDFLCALEQLRRKRRPQHDGDDEVAKALASRGIDPREPTAIRVARRWYLDHHIDQTHVAKKKRHVDDLIERLKRHRAGVDKLFRRPSNLTAENERTNLVLHTGLDAEETRDAIVNGFAVLLVRAEYERTWLEYEFPGNFDPATQGVLQAMEDAKDPRWTPRAGAAVVCYWRLAAFEVDEEGRGSFTDLAKSFGVAARRRQKELPKWEAIRYAATRRLRAIEKGTRPPYKI